MSEVWFECSYIKEGGYIAICSWLGNSHHI
jgi:hypothetical protein